MNLIIAWMIGIGFVALRIYLSKDQWQPSVNVTWELTKKNWKIFKEGIKK